MVTILEANEGSARSEPGEYHEQRADYGETLGPEETQIHRTLEAHRDEATTRPIIEALQADTWGAKERSARRRGLRVAGPSAVMADPRHARQSMRSARCLA